MDLQARLRARDLLLGDGTNHEELTSLLAKAGDGSQEGSLAAAARPVLDQLAAVVDIYAPLGTPEEAVAFAIQRACAFSIGAVIEYCGVSEGSEGQQYDAVRRILADHVDAGHLTVEYVFDCPGCGNMLGPLTELPAGSFQVYCEHGMCDCEHTVDPAKAYATFVNVHAGADTENWV